MISWELHGLPQADLKGKLCERCICWGQLEASEEYLYNLCSKMKLKHDLTDALLDQMALIPTIALGSAFSCGVMFHYCVTGEQIATDDISTFIEAVDEPSPAEERWEGSTGMEHGCWSVNCSNR